MDTSQVTLGFAFLAGPVSFLSPSVRNSCGLIWGYSSNSVDWSSCYGYFVFKHDEDE